MTNYLKIAKKPHTKHSICKLKFDIQILLLWNLKLGRGFRCSLQKWAMFEVYLKLILKSWQIWSVMARYFTLRLYFHSPLARENTLACSWNISPYHTLTHVISIIYILFIWYRRLSRVCWLNIYASAAGTSLNTANQTSDILRYPMDNKFIRYCSW